MADTAARLLHDALLANQPEGASHDEDCVLCAVDSAEAKGEAEVADAVRTFTEAEHFALLTDAVQRETAGLTSEKDALSVEKAELQSRVDVLEAERAALTTERDNIKSEFEAFKADLAEKAEIEERKGERLAKAKAAADHLPEDYFTAERAARWAEMSDEAFEAAMADLVATKPVGAANPVPETAAFSGGEAPTSREADGSTFGSFLRKRGIK